MMFMGTISVIRVHPDWYMFVFVWF
jgi:hypothetical protein